jgi:hypothetical protein
MYIRHQDKEKNNTIIRQRNYKEQKKEVKSKEKQQPKQQKKEVELITFCLKRSSNLYQIKIITPPATCKALDNGIVL